MLQFIERVHIVTEHDAPRPLEFHGMYPSYLVAYKARFRPGHANNLPQHLKLFLPAEQMKELTRKDDVDLPVQIP